MGIKRVLAAAACTTGITLAANGAAEASYVGVKATLGKAAADQLAPVGDELSGKPDDIEVDPVTGDVYVLDVWKLGPRFDAPVRLRVLRFDGDGDFVQASATVAPQHYGSWEAAWDLRGSMAVQRSAANPSLARLLVASGHMRLYSFDLANLTAEPVITQPKYADDYVHGGVVPHVESVSTDPRDGSYVLSGDWTDEGQEGRDLVAKFSADGTRQHSWPPAGDWPAGVPSTGQSSTLLAEVDSATGEVLVVGKPEDGGVPTIWALGAPAAPWTRLYQDPMSPQGESFRINSIKPATHVRTIGGKQHIWVSAGQHFPTTTAPAEGAITNFVRNAQNGLDVAWYFGNKHKPGEANPSIPALCNFVRDTVDERALPSSGISADGRTFYLGTPDGVHVIAPGAAEPMTGCFVQGEAYRPVAKITGGENASINVPVTLSAATSTDDGPIGGYEWDLDNDGAYDDGTGVQVTRTFTTAGTHQVGLRVIDELGEAAVTSGSVSALEAAPVAKLSVSSSTVFVGDAVTLDASTSTGTEIQRYRFDVGAGFVTNLRVATKQVSFDSPGVKTVRAEVADKYNRLATATATITVQARPLPDVPDPTPTPTPTPAPTATPGPNPPADTAAKPAVAVTGKRSGARLALTIRCTSTVACAGNVTVLSGKSRVGTGRLRAAAGKRASLNVKLSAAVQRTLKRKKKVTLTVRVALTGGETVSRSIVIRQGK